jgi:hypothetical protein
VDGDVVTLSNNTIEHNHGETSTLISISLVEDQTLDGQFVTTFTSEALVEEDGGKVTWISYNIPFVQISEPIANGLDNTIY